MHWFSVKFKHITRSILGFELYGIVLRFDTSSAIKTNLNRVLERLIPLIICTDSKFLFDCLVRLGSTRGIRLVIGIVSLRQSYERREIAEIKWIEGSTKLADAMTKLNACSKLKDLIDSNKIHMRATE